MPAHSDSAYCDALLKLQVFCEKHELSFRQEMIRLIEKRTSAKALPTVGALKSCRISADAIKPPSPPPPPPPPRLEASLKRCEEISVIRESEKPPDQPPTPPDPPPRKTGRGCFERTPELRERMRQVAVERWKRARQAGHTHLTRPSA